jgi:hypothetical protein
MEFQSARIPLLSAHVLLRRLTVDEDTDVLQRSSYTVCEWKCLLFHHRGSKLHARWARIVTRALHQIIRALLLRLRMGLRVFLAGGISSMLSSFARCWLLRDVAYYTCCVFAQPSPEGQRLKKSNKTLRYRLNPIVFFFLNWNWPGSDEKPWPSNAWREGND